MTAAPEVLPGSDEEGQEATFEQTCITPEEVITEEKILVGRRGRKAL